MAQTKLNAKLVMCNVPSKNMDAARKFYDVLFGTDDFAPSLNQQVPQLHRPISQDGLNLTISPRQDDREPVTCYFAVEDLDATVKQLVAAGGSVVPNTQKAIPISGPPEAMKIHDENIRKLGLPAEQSAGRMVGLLDPDKNYIVLIELTSQAAQAYFKAGKHQQPLDQAQVDEVRAWRKDAENLLKH